MSFTVSEIVDDLKALGLRRGDSVVVHSSYKSVGPVTGGPRSIIDALAEVLLPDGALLFPNLNIPHEFTAENPPRFDLKKAPLKQSIGIIPELFKFSMPSSSACIPHTR